MNNLIAVTIGDIKGIGVRILIDLWSKNKMKNFVIFSDYKVIKKYIYSIRKKININIVDFENIKSNYKKDKLNIYSYKSTSLEDNTYKSLKYAYNECRKNNCIGILTLPLRKDLIKNKIDKNFIGHTEFFQKLDKKNYSNMILFHKKIIVSPITTHIEVKKIPKFFQSKKLLYKQILNLENCLRNDFNFKKPKLIISGLNPHAGENGQLGNEELNIIIPAVNNLKKIGINIDGPFSADSILKKDNLSKYNCFIFLYHDQALIPFKYISQFSGVNYTGNLSVIRTSPDHGTAYNLIDSKNISKNSVLNSFKLIKTIYKNRKINDFS